MHGAARTRRAGLIVAVSAFCCTAFADGLPGQYQLSNRWRILHDEWSPSSNPALMTERNYLSVYGAFCGGPLTAGNLWQLGATLPFRLYQALGVGIIAENGGPVESIVLNADGTTGSSTDPFRSSNYLAMLSYALNPVGRLSIGANLNIGYHEGFGNSEYGVGLDVGVTYRLLNSPLLGYHIAGISYQNLLPPQLSGGEDEGHAAQLRVSLVSKMWQRRIESMLDFTLADFTADAEQFIGGTKTLEWDGSWVLGVWILRVLKLYGVFSFDGDGVQYWAWALGINVPTLNGGRDLAVAYQFRDEARGDLRATHSVYARMDFGGSREEKTARRFSHRLTWDANNLYTTALEHFHRGRYWDAFFVFSEIAVSYPDFFKMDWVTYYRANCLEQLDMRDVALDMYKQAITDNPRSSIVPFADLGSMRIYYRDGKEAELLETYLRLNAPTVADSLKHHAGYLMGQTMFKQNRLRDALTILARIPQTHPEFIFARHTATVTAYLMGDESVGRDNLDACLTAIPRTPAEREILHKSMLFAGYLFYEQDSLAMSVAALRMVPATSTYYPDALLGLGWAAIKARQWNDADRVGLELYTVASLPVLKAEALLVRAMSTAAQKRFAPALTMLNEASEVLKTVTQLTADSLDNRRVSSETYRAMYEYLAQDVLAQAARARTTRTSAALDSLSTRQRETKSGIDKYLRVDDIRKRQAFFDRAVDEIKTDVDYLRAVVATRAGMKQTIEAVKPIIEKQREIEREIERLKEQVGEMDQK